MSRQTVIRICAVSAILGGTLRAVASFIPETASGIYVLYFAIDIFLFLAIAGLFRVSVTDGIAMWNLSSNSNVDSAISDRK